jgi:hypothetical protein
MFMQERDDAPVIARRPLAGNEADMLLIGRAIVAAAKHFSALHDADEQDSGLAAQVEAEALAQAINRPVLDAIRRVRRAARSN